MPCPPCTAGRPAQDRVVCDGVAGGAGGGSAQSRGSARTMRNVGGRGASIRAAARRCANVRQCTGEAGTRAITTALEAGATGTSGASATTLLVKQQQQQCKTYLRHLVDGVLAAL